jgi:hypothetical protein
LIYPPNESSSNNRLTSKKRQQRIGAITQQAACTLVAQQSTTRAATNAFKRELTNDEIEAFVGRLAGDILYSNKANKIEDIFGHLPDSTVFRCVNKAYRQNMQPRTHPWYKPGSKRKEGEEQDRNLMPDPVNDRLMMDKVNNFHDTIVNHSLVSGVAGETWTRNNKVPGGPQLLLTTKHRSLGFYSADKTEHDCICIELNAPLYVRMRANTHVRSKGSLVSSLNL